MITIIITCERKSQQMAMVITIKITCEKKSKQMEIIITIIITCERKTKQMMVIDMMMAMLNADKSGSQGFSNNKKNGYVSKENNENK